VVWFPAFARHARGLHLSPQGSALYPELQSAFGRLIAVAEQARQQQTVVRLKAPTCAIRWLVPGWWLSSNVTRNCKSP
jgi:LysR family glycine cleavage system transcriptional activator